MRRRHKNRRTGRPKRAGEQNGAGAVIRQQPAHLTLADYGLDDSREGKSQNQRPEDLPAHGKGKRDCLEDGGHNFLKHLPLLVCIKMLARNAPLTSKPRELSDVAKAVVSHVATSVGNHGSST